MGWSALKAQEGPETETDHALPSSVLSVLSEHTDPLPDTHKPDPTHLMAAPKAAQVPNSPQVTLRSADWI